MTAVWVTLAIGGLACFFLLAVSVSACVAALGRMADAYGLWAASLIASDNENKLEEFTKRMLEETEPCGPGCKCHD